MSAEELAESLRRGPFHVALRSAIEHRGLSLARLRAHLARMEVRVAESTLSYWQRGLRHPDPHHALATVRALESVLGLPRDSLVVLVGPGQRGGRARRGPSFAELIREGSVARTLLRELGVDPEGCNADLQPVMVHERVRLRSDRSQGPITSRVVAQCTGAGIDRYIGVYSGDPDCVIGQVAVEAGDGCRLGRVRRDDMCVVFELMFDRGLAEDDIVVIGYSVDDRSGITCPGYFRLFRAQCGPYLLQYELPQDNLPARCVQVVRSNDTRPPTLARELYCDRRGVVSAYFPGVGHGIAGIALEWE